MTNQTRLPFCCTRRAWLIWADSKSNHGLYSLFPKTWWRYTNFSGRFTHEMLTQTLPECWFMRIPCNKLICSLSSHILLYLIYLHPFGGAEFQPSVWIIWNHMNHSSSGVLCFLKNYFGFRIGPSYPIFPCFSRSISADLPGPGFVLRFGFMHVDCLLWVTDLITLLNQQSAIVQRKMGCFEDNCVFLKQRVAIFHWRKMIEEVQFQ